MEIDNKGATLEQLAFLQSIRDEIDLNVHRFESGRKILYDYRKIPREMEEDEWYCVVEEIRECYESVRFFNKLVLMVQAGVITAEALYIWCYKEVTDDLLERLEVLVHWAGTGLDLAANYDSYELARLYSSLTLFLNS
jgi:hypothetical protein